MMVQLIRARVRDREALERAKDRWERELRPRAVDFVGSTGGITADGELVLLARFGSRSAAQTNSARPEQDAWWQEVLAALDGEPSVKDTENVDVLFDHGCDTAGFVQVMEGSGDEAALRALDSKFLESVLPLRPDVLGAYRAYFADGSFADITYFASEAEARAGESQEMPPEVAALFDELAGVVSDMRYHDLTEPWIT